MPAPNILALSGSTRAGSLNTKLLGTVCRDLALLDCNVTRISLADYALPLYDGDLETRDGVPENAHRLVQLFNDHDGYFIVSPEYNGSLTPLLKNTIDWMSRVGEIDGEKVSAFRGKIAAIGAASPGSMGGISMLYHLREILVRLGTLVVSEQVAVGNAGKVFDENDRITDERSAEFLEKCCKSLVFTAGRLRVEP